MLDALRTSASKFSKKTVISLLTDVVLPDLEDIKEYVSGQNYTEGDYVYKWDDRTEKHRLYKSKGDGKFIEVNGTGTSEGVVSLETRSITSIEPGSYTFASDYGVSSFALPSPIDPDFDSIICISSIKGFLNKDEFSIDSNGKFVNLVSGHYENETFFTVSFRTNESETGYNKFSSGIINAVPDATNVTVPTEYTEGSMILLWDKSFGLIPFDSLTYNKDNSSFDIDTSKTTISGNLTYMLFVQDDSIESFQKVIIDIDRFISTNAHVSTKKSLNNVSTSGIVLTKNQKSASCVCDMNIYDIGGLISNTPTKSVRYCNVGDETVQVGIDLPVALSSAEACAVDSDIYLIGGLSTKTEKTVYKLPVNGSKWEVKNPMQTARYDFGAIYTNGRIFVFGGFDGTNYLDSIEIYDPATDMWEYCSTTLPYGVKSPSVAVYKDRVYIFGGENATGQLNKVLSFGVNDHTYLELDAMPVALTESSVVTHNDKILLVGGYNTATGALDSVLEFDLTTGTWITSPVSIQFPRYRHNAEIIDDSIYILNGYNGSAYVTEVEKYSIANYDTVDLPFNASNTSSFVVISSVDGVLIDNTDYTINDDNTITFNSIYDNEEIAFVHGSSVAMCTVPDERITLANLNPQLRELIMPESGEVHLNWQHDSKIINIKRKQNSLYHVTCEIIDADGEVTSVAVTDKTVDSFRIYYEGFADNLRIHYRIEV